MKIYNILKEWVVGKIEKCILSLIFLAKSVIVKEFNQSALIHARILIRGHNKSAIIQLYIPDVDSWMRADTLDSLRLKL